MLTLTESRARSRERGQLVWIGLDWSGARAPTALLLASFFFLARASSSARPFKQPRCTRAAAGVSLDRECVLWGKGVSATVVLRLVARVL